MASLESRSSDLVVFQWLLLALPDESVLTAPDHTAAMGQGHVIEIFSAGCPLCRHVSDVIEVGRCRGCTQIVHDVRAPTPEVAAKMSAYGVNAVPTVVIDAEIRITGIPQFPWVCDDDLYRRLREEYPLNDSVPSRRG